MAKSSQDYDDGTALVRRGRKPNITSKRIPWKYWPLIICVNIYDFLALCHLVPTHALHLHRPFLVTPYNFPIPTKDRPHKSDLVSIAKQRNVRA